MADTIMQPREVFLRTYAETAPEADVVLAMFETDRPEKFGMVRLGTGGRVIAIEDKPQGTDLSLMWGAIIWRPSFGEYLHAKVHHDQISDFALIMNSAIRDGLRFQGVKMADGLYIDLGTYDEIMEMDRRYREG